MNAPARLGSQSPREARSAQATIVRDISTGEVIARTNYKFLMPWGAEYWVCDAVAEHFDAETAEDVHCEDTDDGRFYSLNGKPAAYVEGEYEPLWEMLQEAAE